MPGVSTGGTCGTKFTPVLFFDYDVTLNWFTAFKVFGSEILLFVRISQNTCHLSSKLEVQIKRSLMSIGFSKSYSKN